MQRFLQLYPDPEAHFRAADRQAPSSPGYSDHVISDLMARFPFQSKAKVVAAFKKYKLYLNAVEYLESQKNSRSTKRRASEIQPPKTPVCPEFLKEKKYLELEPAITKKKTERAVRRTTKLAAAKKSGELVECQCCYLEDLLVEEMVFCQSGHVFCVDCVSQAATVALGEDRTGLECLGLCDQQLDWRRLDLVLDPLLLSKLLQKKQQKEVETAGLEGMVACPFCPYMTVMEDQEDKVVVCRNPQCGRESCRLCRESNHIPLRCDEVKKADGLRKEIEERLTGAMVRECWSCKKKVRQ